MRVCLPSVGGGGLWCRGGAASLIPTIYKEVHSGTKEGGVCCVQVEGGAVVEQVSTPVRGSPLVRAQVGTQVTDYTDYQ